MKINWETGTDMAQRIFVAMAVMLLVSGAASPGLAQQLYLYSPNAINNAQKVDKKDGVLVQEMHVQKGDNLYDISRKFSGHGTYYPQILLFNKLNNPNKIYPGNVIRVPVDQLAKADTGDRNQIVASGAVETPQTPSRKHSKAKNESRAVAAPLELSTVDLGKSDQGRVKKQSRKKATAKKSQRQKRTATKEPSVRVAPSRAVQRQAPAPALNVSSTSSQKLFEQAVKAYRMENYRSALALFDRFLADYPSSPLAPDASFYKAECYLKQSNQ
jgi:LysM repeat protein